MKVFKRKFHKIEDVQYKITSKVSADEQFFLKITRRSPSSIIHRDFLNRFSMYHINRLFIIQYYPQLRIGGCNEKGEFSLPTIKRKEDACSLAQGLCIFEK